MTIESPTQDNIDSSVTILWGVERGRRLALWRMNARLTQKELGAKLGIRQQMLDRIESGQKLMCSEFTLRAFKAIVGDGLNYILFNSGPGYGEVRQVLHDFFQYQHKKMQHKKRIKKRTNEEQMKIDGWHKSDRWDGHGWNKNPDEKRGNRKPGPRPKNEDR